MTAALQHVVLGALHSPEVGSVDEVVAATGLARSEVEEALAGLQERGLVRWSEAARCWVIAA